ncbi:RNA dependent RNA polymerase [Diplodia seriata splipalmivirus 1]|uniref:RNA dependent RNA polymerase n=1 Tax=Diplodia seriata splipalmivirus 1 TaxID=2932870 RepID=A0A8T9JLH4_9VIRU|nr:RNA dependent RNA polymerase [Diplodia seriata splipalmivirus 1]
MQVPGAYPETPPSSSEDTSFASASEGFRTPHQGPRPPFAESPVAKLEPFDVRKHVLTTKSFPSTSILRWKPEGFKCACREGEQHLGFFNFVKTHVRPRFEPGFDGKPLPAVKVCWNAENIWECKLPRSLTRLENRVEFEDLPNVGHAIRVLNKGTYWFGRINFRKDGTVSPNGIAVSRLLGGLTSYSGPEPHWSLMKRPVVKSGVRKLKQILATVDGLLMQICLSFPEKDEALSWKRLDQVANCLISQMLPDYFRDDKDLTTFEKVKRLRKEVKYQGFNPVGSLSRIEIPRELSFFQVFLDFIGESKTPLSMYKVSLLCQTRASGVPPMSVYYKTLRKLKAILLQKGDLSVYNRVKGYINHSIDMIHYDICEGVGGGHALERFFSHCLDSAKISLSDSGEFFTKSEDGGKYEASRRVLSNLGQIEEIDLWTGEFTGRMLDKTNSNPGNLLFQWACHMFRDRKSVYDRNVMSTRISLVAELGKYRGITVSHLAHAILLHVLSHVLLTYISAVPSSSSGVKAANHAWNFFKALSHKNPHANFLFGDKEVYLFSVDWENATDYCDHAVAQAMLNRICHKVGIPTWYRQTCVFALCAPRQVEFLDPESKTLECFFTERGELMGDPVVKVILHLYHLVARYSALYQIRQTRPT